MPDQPRYLADMEPLERAFTEVLHDVSCDEGPPHSAAAHEPFDDEDERVPWDGMVEAFARQGIRVVPITPPASDHEALFDLQWTRMREATKAWQKAHPGNDLVWPDLGELLTWLLSQRGWSTTTVLDMAVAMNTAQIEADEISLGRDLTPVAERILRALPAKKPKLDGWHVYHTCGGVLREITAIYDDATSPARDFMCPVCGQWFRTMAEQGVAAG